MASLCSSGNDWFTVFFPNVKSMLQWILASLMAQLVKNLPAMQENTCSTGDLSSIPGSGRSPGEGNGNPLQYSCLENPMDGGAWGATVHGVAKSRTQLSDLTFNFQCWRSWSWRVLWRPTRPSRTNTQKRCPFHYRGLECKSRKSRDTWSNRQIWPWSKKWSRTKANSVLPREHTGHSKHPLPTTQEKTLHLEITRWSISTSH